MPRPNPQNLLVILGMLCAVSVVVILAIIKNSLGPAPAAPASSPAEDARVTPPLAQDINPLVTNAPGYDPLGLTEPTVTSISPQLGTRAAAKVALVEFSDLGCPYCSTMHARVAAAISQFPDQVLWVWKDLPVTHMREESRMAHVAARCAWKQSKFWSFIQEVFEDQGELGEKLYDQVAIDLGLNMPRFSSCLNKPEDVGIFIDYDIEEARALGVSGTPYLFLVPNDGRPLVRFSGALTTQDLTDAISSLIGTSK